LALPKVWVDVTRLSTATEVCLGAHCVSPPDGIAQFESPAISNSTHQVDLVVRNRGGSVIARKNGLRLPRAYPNGKECGGDAPQGTITFDGTGKTSVSTETHGFGSTTTSIPTEPRLLDCDDKPTFKPSDHLLACGDANLVLTNLKWDAWGDEAIGRGDWVQNDCIPDCARGTFRRYELSQVVLDRPTATSRGVLYNRLTATFADPKMAGRPTEVVEPLVPVSLR
jgi:hypothetical protein